MDTLLKRGAVIWLKTDKETMSLIKKLLGDNIQSFDRPFLVVTNKKGVVHSPVIQILPLSKNTNKISYKFPFHSLIKKNGYSFLTNDSVVLTEQIITINKKHIEKVEGILRKTEMKAVNRALRIQLGL